MIRYLTLEEILRLHHEIINDFGGVHGVRDENRLKSVVYAPAQSVFSEDQYKTIQDKASVYIRNIIADHPFIDGNKRTAVTIMGIFLMRNKIRLRIEAKELEDFAVQVAVEHLTIEQIAEWLTQHTTYRQD